MLKRNLPKIVRLLDYYLYHPACRSTLPLLELRLYAENTTKLTSLFLYDS